jgi:hypothetical protein
MRSGRRHVSTMRSSTSLRSWLRNVDPITGPNRSPNSRLRRSKSTSINTLVPKQQCSSRIDTKLRTIHALPHGLLTDVVFSLSVVCGSFQIVDFIHTKSMRGSKHVRHHNCVHIATRGCLKAEQAVNQGDESSGVPSEQNKTQQPSAFSKRAGIPSTKPA